MSTGYRVEVGYNSSWHRDDAWERLKAEAQRVRSDGQAILAEARRVEALRVDEFSAEVLGEYVAAYAADADLTLTIHESASEDERPCIRQLASGGGESRDIKELLRRAFCRLLIAAMHREGIEVNLVVS